MILVVNLLLIAFLLTLGYRRTKESSLRSFFWPGLLLKVSMGALLGLLYTYYYPGGDTFSMFESALRFKEIGFSSWHNFTDLFFRSAYEAYPDFQYAWIPSAFFIKILALLACITGDSYWLTGIYLSIFSFYGLWLWINLLTRLTENKTLAVVAGFLFPSILFWSGGVIKDALAIPALAVILAQFTRYFLGDRLNPRHIILALVMFIILAITKYFMAAIILAVMLAIVVTRKLLRPEVYWLKQLLVFAGSLVVIAGLVSLLHPNLWPTRMAEVIYTNYQAYLIASEPAKIIVYPDLKPGFISLISHMPQAIFNGLFLPLTIIKGSAISWLSVIENWILLSATLAAIFALPSVTKGNLRLLVWGGLTFVMISAGLIALAAPNLGTLARYKASYLLVYMPLVLSGLIVVYRKYVRKA